MLDSRQSRPLGKALHAGSLFGKVSQEARVEGAGEVRPGKSGDSGGRAERWRCTKVSGPIAASQEASLG